MDRWLAYDYRSLAMLICVVVFCFSSCTISEDWAATYKATHACPKVAP